MALLQAGLALGAYAGTRVAEEARRPRRLGRLLRARGNRRARQLLDRGLPEPAPARVLRGGAEVRSAVDRLRPGDIVLLATGEPVPVDGRIRAGSISVDQQRLTGESVPRALGPGDPVYAGTLVVRGAAEAEVTMAGRDTTLSRAERLLRDTAVHNTRLQLEAEAFADTAAAPLLAASALAWPLIGPSAAVAILFSAPINAVRAAGIAIDIPAQGALAAAEAQGATALLVATAAGVQGVIGLSARPRPEAAGIVHFLADHGIAHIALVSGDAEAPTRALAQDLGIEHAHSNVLPEGKAALVRALQAAGRRVCFIGDGVNDALAMRAADCAISLRDGATLATDTAGILLLDGSLRGLPRLLTTARSQHAELRRLLAYWGGYALLNTGLNVGLRIGVLPSSLLFGAAFSVGLLRAARREAPPARSETADHAHHQT